MGNCCSRQSSTLVVPGEDRRSLPSKSRRNRKHSDKEVEDEPSSIDQRHRLHSEKRSSPSSSITGATMHSSEGGAFREVKIKMTKKELEELVGWLNMADSSFEQVMSRLANVISNQGDDDGDNDGQVVHLRQRSWRPSLQSIPEVS